MFLVVITITTDRTCLPIIYPVGRIVCDWHVEFFFLQVFRMSGDYTTVFSVLIVDCEYQIIFGIPTYLT